MLDDLGLVATVEWFLVAFSRRTGIATEFAQDDAGWRLLPELEMCLYRIVQEATTNVARHAHARTCHVELRYSPPTVVLIVKDDGRGFNAHEAMSPGRRSGLGLLGMEERVAGFGGRFRAESTPGEGTRIVVELPATIRSEEAEVEANDVAAVDGMEAAAKEGVH
jgi:signal transduction histidine kinase